MEVLTGIIVGLVVGGGALYAVLRSRAVRLETQLDERTRQLETTLRERDEARGERDARAGELAQATAEISGYQSTQTAREKALEERRAELDTHFKGLASEVLKSNTEEFRSRRPNSSSSSRSWPART